MTCPAWIELGSEMLFQVCSSYTVCPVAFAMPLSVSPGWTV